MYIEQMIITDYLVEKAAFDNASEEEQWNMEEPEPPDVYLRDEELEYASKEPETLPDVLGALALD